jgi:hypothetical protein
MAPHLEAVTTWAAVKVRSTAAAFVAVTPLTRRVAVVEVEN